jgi:GAF domain-containing protein
VFELLAPAGDPDARIDIDTVKALQHLTDATLAYLSEDELLAELLARVSDIMSIDTVAILLLEGDMLHARAAKGIEEEVEAGVRIPLGRGFAGRIAAERQPVRIIDVEHADIYNPILREKGIRSLLGVPLLVEGRVIGVLHVGSLTTRNFTAEEATILQLAADRAALAIELGRKLASERGAREEAERVAARLRAVQRVSDASLGYLTEEELLQELLARISNIMSVDTVAFLLLEGDVLHARAALGLEEEVEAGVRVPMGRGFAGRVAAERRPVTILDLDHADIYNPILREKGLRSLLGVPLLIGGRVVGVLHVGSLTTRRFTDDEVSLLQLAADRAALAIEQARHYEQRRLAEALQRRLLPRARPEGLEADIASQYLPASGTSVGGDWHDVFVLAERRLGMVIGDVAGHGITAAAAMAQLRTALRAYALEGHPPVVVVDRVNRLMGSLGPHMMTTLVFVVVDPAAGSMEFVNAGHPPPLLIPASGPPRFLTRPLGPVLGMGIEAAARSGTQPVSTGDIVLLYTDGLVERRTETLDVGLERLRSLADGIHDVDELSDAILDHLVPRAHGDDIAFIAARLR